MTTPDTSAVAWNIGIAGLTPALLVWAYVCLGTDGECVDLVRGRQVDAFLEEGTDRRLFCRILCWTESNERPQFDTAAARAVVEGIEYTAEYEASYAFAAENWVHREALRAVVYGNPDAVEIAQIALGSRDLEFFRHYG